MFLNFKTYRYEGEYNTDGLRHGTGKTRYCNGDTYEGEYHLGKREGKGKYWLNNF